jgi:uncharacterized protein YegL
MMINEKEIFLRPKYREMDLVRVATTGISLDHSHMRQILIHVLQVHTVDRLSAKELWNWTSISSIEN